MTDHYYTDKPISKNNVFRYDVNINEVQFQFFSNSGVFSKQGIDFGSRLLIDTVLEDADMIESGLSNEEKPSLADLGCGIGVIGIVLNRLLKINSTYLYDINERAITLAKMNIDNNASKRTFAIKKDIVNEQILERADICVSNPPIRAGKKTVFAFYESDNNKDFAAHPRPPSGHRRSRPEPPIPPVRVPEPRRIPSPGPIPPVRPGDSG